MNILNFLRLLYRFLYEFQTRNYVYNLNNQKQLNNLKNSYAGMSCIIVGNGKSLRISDLERLKKYYFFAANRIYTIFDQTHWRPDFYFAQDPSVIRKIHKILSTLSLENKFVRQVGPKKYFVQNSISYKIDTTRYFMNKKPLFSINPAKVVYDGYTVTFTMIQFAVFMGFTKIILIGNDFNYNLVDGMINQNSYFNSKFFDKKSTGDLPNLDYWKKSFEVAKLYCQEIGIEILNATRGGDLEVFDRVDIESLF